MARPLQVLSLLSRLGALSVKPSVSVNSCRFVSKGARKAWTGQSHVDRDRASHRAHRYSGDMSEDELDDMEEVEEKLQALVNEERRVQKKVKYQILRRQMTPKGAPERKLTWDAIEQIKYLKQEHPDEWTVERLAEGFSVSPDVILRVLRSKFVPAPERKAQQDTKVLARLGQQVLPSGAGTGQDRLKLPTIRTPVALPPGSKSKGAVVPVARALMLKDESSGSLVNTPAPVTLLPTQSRAGIRKDVPVVRSEEEEDSTSNTTPAEWDIEDEESWDRRPLTDEELEEFMDMEKPRPVVKVGKDFFDAEGNFLYRI